MRWQKRWQTSWEASEPADRDPSDHSSRETRARRGVLGEVAATPKPARTWRPRHALASTNSRATSPSTSSTHTLAHDLEQALAREQTAQSRFGTASAEEARARDNHDRLHAQLEAGRALLDAHSGADDVERTRHDAEQATHADQEARAEQARLEREHEQLSAGRSPRPPGLEAFQSVLAEHGIESALLADLLEVEHETAAEAALGDGVWALVVNDARYEQALALAEQHSHRLPIVRAGEGAPRGVFAGATGLEQALAYLGELDRPLGDRPGHVSERGRVRGEHWAAYRAPARPALGEKARQHAITQIEARLADLTRELPLFAQRAEELRTRAETIAAAARAASALPAAAKRLREGEIELTEAKNGLAELTGSSAELGEELGRVKSVLDQLRREHAEVEAGLPRQEADALSATRRVSELESELATAPLTPEQAALDRERSREQLEGEHIVLDEQLARFSEEEQSPAIVAEVADQEQRLQRAQEMVAGKRELLDRVEDVAREAKRRLRRPRAADDRPLEREPPRDLRTRRHERRTRTAAFAYERRGVRARGARRAQPRRRDDLLPGLGPLRRRTREDLRLTVACGDVQRGRGRPTRDGRAHRAPRLKQHR